MAGDDPIVAIATAPGRAAIGIVRASGADLSPLIDAVCARPLLPRQAHYLPFLDAHGAAIDQGLAMHFPAPHSATGEDVLELHAHGGPVVLQMLLARCLEGMPALRLARPGEFTQRAFLNDKLDLAQAEAVADLIDASTEAAARSAGRSLAGAFSAEIERLAEGLLRLRSLVEATLDFPEEDLDFLEQADARGQLDALAAQLRRVLGQARQGALLRDGLRLVIVGQPNAGKSSLLNALAGVERAIVTPTAGTTRDTIALSIQIEGVPIHLVDTAGLRDDATDEVERLGIARSWAAVADADAVLWLRDATRVGEPDYEAADAALAARLTAAGTPPQRLLPVFNKSDAARPPPHPAALVISARTGAGLEALRQAVLTLAGRDPGAGVESLFMARARHLDALHRTQAQVLEASALLQRSPPPLDLLAEVLRLAHRSLGEITGAMTADEVLGEIFSRFCIGK